MLNSLTGQRDMPEQITNLVHQVTDLIEGSNTLGVNMSDDATQDDKIVRGEFHIPVGKPVLFKFHSRDVLHSAYMPHFRAQMNCVPGMTTQFHFVPTITSGWK
jgi:cytochrome c oxidase subunit 2